MRTRFWLIGVAPAAFFAGAAVAQYPIMDMIAQRVIETYQTSTCEQLWQSRGKPASAEEQRAISVLRGDPQMRQAFFNQIAGPVMNKMFDCGMIP